MNPTKNTMQMFFISIPLVILVLSGMLQQILIVLGQKDLLHIQLLKALLLLNMLIFTLLNTGKLPIILFLTFQKAQNWLKIQLIPILRKLLIIIQIITTTVRNSLLHLIAKVLSMLNVSYLIKSAKTNFKHNLLRPILLVTSYPPNILILYFHGNKESKCLVGTM